MVWRCPRNPNERSLNFETLGMDSYDRMEERRPRKIVQNSLKSHEAPKPATIHASLRIHDRTLWRRDLYGHIFWKIEARRVSYLGTRQPLIAQKMRSKNPAIVGGQRKKPNNQLDSSNKPHDRMKQGQATTWSLKQAQRSRQMKKYMGIALQGALRSFKEGEPSCAHVKCEGKGKRPRSCVLEGRTKCGRMPQDWCETIKNKARRRAKFDHRLSNPSATKLVESKAVYWNSKKSQRVLTAYVPSVVTDTVSITHHT